MEKCIGDPESILPIEGLGVKDKLTYEEFPVTILYRKFKKLRNKEVAYIKVLLRNQLIEGATLEVEDDIKSRYPHLFEN